jgi:DMSO/TMAO reductase YedYZ molybdopterin-dependent catalytic subunit
MRRCRQYLVDGFPVLSASPTPRTPLEEWDFSIEGEVDEPKRWTREEFRHLPSKEVTADIHRETKWSKLETRWEGVSVDTLLLRQRPYPVGPRPRALPGRPQIVEILGSR